MNIKPSDKTIKDLLLSQKQFIIPRFQREYSWDKKHYKEFFEDMIGCLKLEGKNIVSTQYFLGTMLFVGNFTEGKEREILVVDGQQRLTTITILFSAMSDVFKLQNENILADQIFRYIMTTNDNGDEIRVLKSKSHYPYFAYFIQDKNKTDKPQPVSEEEVNIKETYDYFIKLLKEKELKKLLLRNLGQNCQTQINSLKLVDILKALRDQILNTMFVSISTEDIMQANKIFEILNAKGKSLAYIDLIKNKIFETLNVKEPADFAEEKWKELKSKLYSQNECVGLATFYQHYWNSKYCKSVEKKLYDNFIKQKICKNENTCKNFLNDLIVNAEYYMKIVNPNRSDYDNRKEYFWLVQSLHSLITKFGIVQVRIALMALYDIKHRDLISTSSFKKVVTYLENIHFAYNAVVSNRANKFEKIYSIFAIALRKSSSIVETDKIIKEKLISELEKIYPSYDEFVQNFVNLSYSKKDNLSNMKTSYAINKLYCYLQGEELFPDNGSIEHIIPESNNTCGIGNLILLERKLNDQAGQLPYEKKREIYARSSYKCVKDFIDHNDTFTIDSIDERAKSLAQFYYEKILNRTV